MSREPKTERGRIAAASRRIGKALDAGAHLELSDLEQRYLVALVRTGRRESARLSLGMKIYKEEELTRKLNAIGLVSEDCNLIPHPDDLADLFAKYQPAKVQPVIPSPPARTIFSFLSERYEHVFPELTLASFLNLDELGEIVAERQARWYAMTCRIDFIVCGAGFLPRFAVEYQGGGHDRVKMQQKDDLKAGMLTAAGIRLYQLRPQDLQALEAVFVDYPPLTA